MSIGLEVFRYRCSAAFVETELRKYTHHRGVFPMCSLSSRFWSFSKELGVVSWYGVLFLALLRRTEHVVRRPNFSLCFLSCFVLSARQDTSNKLVLSTLEAYFVVLSDVSKHVFGLMPIWR